MEIETTTRKWGNSLGIRLPRDFVKRENIKENTKIRVDIVTESNINDIFGILKDWKIDSQKIKDEFRDEEFSSEKRKWKR